MAGLIQMAQEQGSPAPNSPPAAAPESGAAPSTDGEREPNVTPEEQEIYSQFVNNCREVIYPKGEDGQVNPKVVENLKATDNPVDNLASALVEVISQVMSSAEAAKAPWTADPQMESDIAMGAGEELMDDLVQIAQGMKIHDYTQDEINGAATAAIQLYGEQMEALGKTDKDQLSAQFGDIMKSKENGTLGQLLPGVADEEAGEPADMPEQEPQE